MPQYSSGSIAAGVTITGKAWNGTVGGIYAKFCNGAFSIAGSLDLSIKGFRGGVDANNTNTFSAYGEGSSGASGTATTGAANGNGGGGAKKWVGGGGGGNGGAGGNAGINTWDSGYTVGLGGAAVGNAGLTSMFPGGGGGGASHDPGTPGGDASGTRGGGIVLIIAKTITITGSILNTSANAISWNNGTHGTGGGGGAGGSVLLKGQVITLGTGLVVATGNIGGHYGNNNTDSSWGGDGGTGRIHADYSTSITGSTSPTIDTTNDLTLADGNTAGFFNFF
jgi:hypothetical protein